MPDNKLVRTIIDAVILTGLAAGIVMSYAKFAAVMAGSVALKQYLEDQKILPTS